MEKRADIRIGTAAWNLPKQHASHFAAVGPEGQALSHLERYARVFHCVEINSSFYRPHRHSTWERWAATVPANFRFSVKIPKTITHEAKLNRCGAYLQAFLDQVKGLGEKLGPLLVQLPPKLAFDEEVAREFFMTLRELHGAAVVLEPRHATWFTPAANRLLREFEVARAAADPPAGSPLACDPGGWDGLRYYRLHGSPRTYYTEYCEAFLQALAETVRAGETTTGETWVIFDNTALGHATSNALALHWELNRRS